MLTYGILVPLVRLQMWIYDDTVLVFNRYTVREYLILNTCFMLFLMLQTFYFTHCLREFARAKIRSPMDEEQRKSLVHRSSVYLATDVEMKDKKAHSSVYEGLVVLEN